MERISNSQLEILINCGVNTLDRSRTISALQELKERRAADGKPLDIKGQLRLARDRCPDVWEEDIQYCPSFYGLEQFSFDDCMRGCKSCCKECWDKALEGEE